MLESLLWLGLCAIAAGGFMGFLHYYIRRRLGYELKPPWTYVVGVLGIYIPFAAWCAIHFGFIAATMPALMPIVGFGICAAIPGVVIFWCYDADRRAEMLKALTHGVD